MPDQLRLDNSPTVRDPLRLPARVVSVVATMVVVAAATGQAIAAPTTRASRITTKSPSTRSAATTKSGRTTKSATTVAPGGPVAVGKAAAQPARKAKVVQPGQGLDGWEQRGPGDWPATDAAIAIEPINKSVLVRPTPDTSDPGLLLTSGASVSGDLGLLAVGEQNGWLKVLIPVRPNGTVGWVDPATVRLRRTAERVVVDLNTNQLTLFVNGKATRTETVAAGTSGTPTPDGLFFVKSIVPQANPAGGRGPYVLVLSAFSNVLNSFDGGQGAVGIHGTSAPGKLGQDVSHGCIRTSNDTITAFAKMLRPGTPVEIHRNAAAAPSKRWTPPQWVLDAANAGASSGSVNSGSSGTNPTSTTADASHGAPSSTIVSGTGSGVGSAAVPVTGLP